MSSKRAPRSSPVPVRRRRASFAKVNERDCTVKTPNVYNGRKTLEIGYYFRRKDCSRPVLLLTYKIPPGGSEGSHTHRLNDKKTGSYDEFYYVISGAGRMHIDGRDIPIRSGDYVCVPNGVTHDVQNTSKRRSLKVHLVAIERKTRRRRGWPAL